MNVPQEIKINLDTYDSPERMRISHLIEEHNMQKSPRYTSEESTFFFSLKKDSSLIGGIYGLLWMKTIHVERLYVHRDYRHQGYGSALLEQTEKWGSNQGCVWSKLETLSFQNNLAFYSKRGYVQVYEDKAFSEKMSIIYLRKAIV